MTLDELANKFNRIKKEGGATTPVLKKALEKAKPYYKKIIHQLDTPSGLEYSQQDLEQTASLYVVKALQNYDSSLDSKFSTYMYLRVRGGLIQYMRKHDTLTRTQRKRAGKLQEATNALCQKLERNPSVRELAEYMDESVDDVLRYIRQRNSRRKSTDNSVSDEANPVDQAQVEQKVESSFQQSVRKDLAKKKMRSLDVRSRVILVLVYYHDLTTKQIGKIVDIHNQYVSTLKQRALEQLRKK